MSGTDIPSQSQEQEKDLFATSGNPCGQDTNPPGMPAGETDLRAVTCLYRRTPPVEHEETYPSQPGDNGHTQPISNPVDIHPHRTSDPMRRSEQGNPMDSPSELEHNYLRLASSSTTTSSFAELSLSGRLSDSFGTCFSCNLLMQSLKCEDSKQFWKEIDEAGPDPCKRCHIKFSQKLFEKLNDTFPGENGLKSKMTVNLLKYLLNIDMKDPTAGVKLADLKRAIELFGPIKSQDKKCVLVIQLHQLLKMSLKARDKDKRVKSSWFAGEMSRDESERVLLAPDCKDKTYLVRISGTDGDDGDFVLSVRHEDHCHHLKIKGNPDKALTEVPYHAHLKFAGREFASLVECVDYVTKKQTIDIEVDDESEAATQNCKSVTCLRVFQKSPLNAVMSGYERAK